MGSETGERWIVRVEPELASHPAYAREVRTDGPSPDEAIIKALKDIRESPDNDLWQRRKLTVTVEQVR